MIEYLVAHSWWVWVALVLLFGIIELFTLEMTAAALSISSLVGLVVSLFSSLFWVEVIAAVVAAIALLLFVRPPLLRVLRRSTVNAITNVEAVVGLTGVVASIAGPEMPATVRLSNGETWTAVAASTDLILVDGQSVSVTEVQGARVVVAPLS